jgi:curved DNA-binding protein
MAVEIRDPYEVLGVARGAGPDEIQRAYRRLARRHHPDVSAEAGAADRFREVVAAYRVLADPKRRREYDRTRLRGGPVVEITVGVESAYLGGRRSVTVPGPDGRPRLYDVDLPAGTVDGARLRLPDGVLLVIRLAPHPRYRVAGRDVMVEVPLSPWEAALGAVVPVPRPGGDLHLDVPAGSSSGRRLRLRGHGLPDPRGLPGDLYAELRIVVPERLTPGERALFASLARESAFVPRPE